MACRWRLTVATRSSCTVGRCRATISACCAPWSTSWPWPSIAHSWAARPPRRRRSPRSTRLARRCCVPSPTICARHLPRSRRWCRACSTSDEVEWRPEQVHDALLTVDEETDRLNRLVGDLLDASRLQIGALAVNCQTVDVAESIGVTLAGIGAAADRVEVEVPPGLPPAIRRPGAVRTEPRQRGDQRPASRWAVSGATHRRCRRPARSTCASSIVGPGIPEQLRERVMAPFVQLGDGRSR